ncbi:unnamed protein product [Peniophora sp. CBMAI 1063]|nr:unnamed protein product [Peniophora sp. CBMAI 1063]
MAVVALPSPLQSSIRSPWATFAEQRFHELDGLIWGIQSQRSELALNRQKIAKELDDLHRIQRQLIMRHNALLPVSSLPAEIMCIIFEYAAQAERPHARLRQCGGAASLGWIRLGHISARWRSILLGHKHLWAGNVCALPLATVSAVHRAGAVPVNIRYDVDDVADSRSAERSVYRALLEPGVRIGNLSLTARSSFLQEIAAIQLTCPLPSLNALHLECHQRPHWEVHVNETCMLPRNLLAGKAPALRTLILKRCFLPWSSSLLSGLTHLEIRLDSHSIPEHLYPTEEGLLGVLASNSSLSTLVLAFCLPRTGLGTSTAVVSLPKLARLTLGGDADSCAWFWSHVHAPTLQTAGVVAASQRGHGADCLEIVPLVAPYVRTRGIRALSIQTQHFDIRMDAYGTACSPDDVEWEAANALDSFKRPHLIDRDLQSALSLTFPRWASPSNGGYRAVVNDIARGLELKDIETLSVEVADDHFGSAEWVNAFKHLVHIRALHVRGAPARSLLDALANAEEVLFPGLQILSLQGVNLLRSEVSLSDVCLALMERRRLSELRIVSCTVDRSWVDAVKGGIVSVVLDGVHCH